MTDRDTPTRERVEQAIEQAQRIHTIGGWEALSVILVDAATVALPHLPTEAEQNAVSHMCGLMGFNPMLGDNCPACNPLEVTNDRS